MAIWNCEGNLLGGLGISPGHTAYGESKATVDAWALGKSIGRFSEYSYTRPDKGSINAYAPGSVHVDLPYDATTQIDYVMFKNTDVDADRWYYGQVMHREYVNVNSTRLWFNLDYWLTFMDELKAGIGACLVERSHVKQADDWNGDIPKFQYLNPETYVPQTIEKMYVDWNTASQDIWDNLTPDTFIIFAASDENGAYDYDFRFIGGVPSSCYVKVCNSIEELLTTIKSFNETFPLLDNSNVEAVQAVVYVPKELTEEGAGPAHFWSTNMPKKSETLRTDGDPIHNAKCLTFPYCYATAKAPTGQQAVIKFEEYATAGGLIRHYVEGGGGIESRYRYGVRQNITDDRCNMKYMNLPSYPQIPIHSDTFAQWAGANGISSIVGAGIASIMIATGVGALGGIGPAMSAIMSGGAVGNAAALTNVTLGASMLADRVGNLTQATAAPDRMVGASTSTEAVAFNLYRIGFYINKPSDEDLTAVDDFFDAYGYCINRYMVPELKVRQYYTYVKTSNANCRAAVPADGINQFCAMLNNGCTFWDVASGDIGVKRRFNPDA